MTKLNLPLPKEIADNIATYKTYSTLDDETKAATIEDFTSPTLGSKEPIDNYYYNNNYYAICYMFEKVVTTILADQNILAISSFTPEQIKQLYVDDTTTLMYEFEYKEYAP
jgi:hypothetical protein